MKYAVGRDLTWLEEKMTLQKVNIDKDYLAAYDLLDFILYDSSSKPFHSNVLLNLSFFPYICPSIIFGWLITLYLIYWLNWQHNVTIVL